MIRDDQKAAIAELARDRPPPASALAALHDRLAERAQDAGLLDVAYRTVDSPVGKLLVAATPAGLVRLAFEREGFEAVIQRLAAGVSPRVLAHARPLDAVTHQLEEYFEGRRSRFEVAVDLRLASGFRRQVLRHLPRITYGTTASYAAVAAAVERPRAIRAVGSACATNPLPLVIPCHRVIRSDGGLGNYVGGADTKRHLLEWEAAT